MEAVLDLDCPYCMGPMVTQAREWVSSPEVHPIERVSCMACGARGTLEQGECRDILSMEPAAGLDTRIVMYQRSLDALRTRTRRAERRLRELFRDGHITKEQAGLTPDKENA